jgi:hypothetical protein
MCVCSTNFTTTRGHYILDLMVLTEKVVLLDENGSLCVDDVHVSTGVGLEEMLMARPRCSDFAPVHQLVVSLLMTRMNVGVDRRRYCDDLYPSCGETAHLLTLDRSTGAHRCHTKHGEHFDTGEQNVGKYA